MRGSISNLIYYLLVFTLQVIVGNHFDGWAWLHFCFIPLILIGFPPTWDVRISMPAAFLLGLAADLATGGIPGINAAAAVILVVLKDPLYRALVSPDGQNPAWTPTLRSIGTWPYLRLSLAFYAIYLLAYVLLDAFTLRPVFFLLAKTALSVVVNVALAALLSLFLPEKN